MTGAEEQAPLPAPSPSGAPDTLLLRLDRTFRVWSYGVGHSHLLLRSRKEGTDRPRLDLHFEAVDVMRLVRRYEGLELHTVDDDMTARLHEESGVPAALWDTRLVVALRSRSGTGYVQCGRVVVDRHQDDEDPPPGAARVRDVAWSLRPADLRSVRGGRGDLEGFTGRG
ncbi:hypothetical protein [Streptomyces sp. bgisy091]|uniref:hypothetical protein n=1 Tax=Streptomyces sp. bgisy091 TaxID=3413778 RepID=UPI003D739B4F